MEHNLRKEFAIYTQMTHARRMGLTNIQGAATSKKGHASRCSLDALDREGENGRQLDALRSAVRYDSTTVKRMQILLCQVTKI